MDIRKCTSREEFFKELRNNYPENLFAQAFIDLLEKDIKDDEKYQALAYQYTIWQDGYVKIRDCAIENIETIDGFKCVSAIYSDGHRCGYVGIPRIHKYYGRDYDSIPVDCHGGLTYGGYKYPIDDNCKYYYIGFDFAHLGDGYDFDKAEQIWKDDSSVLSQLNIYRNILGQGEVRTLKDVRNECERIVKQLKEC